jgi:hypothetical protein
VLPIDRETSGTPGTSNFNSGGSNFGYQMPRNNGNQPGRGGYPQHGKNQGGLQPNQYNNQGGKNNPNSGQGFQQKQKLQNKGFRGGGN